MTANSIVRTLCAGGILVLSASVISKIAPIVGRESEEMSRLYKQARSMPGWETRAELRLRTIEICAKDYLQSSVDFYRAASVLVQSRNEQDVLLAQDLALASVMGGFRPGVKVVAQAQKALLGAAGIDEIPEPTFEQGRSGTSTARLELDKGHEAVTRMG